MNTEGCPRIALSIFNMAIRLTLPRFKRRLVHVHLEGWITLPSLQPDADVLCRAVYLTMTSPLLFPVPCPASDVRHAQRRAMEIFPFLLLRREKDSTRIRLSQVLPEGDNHK